MAMPFSTTGFHKYIIAQEKFPNITFKKKIPLDKPRESFIIPYYYFPYPRGRGNK